MGAKVPLVLAAALAAATLTGCRIGSVRDEDVSLAAVRDAVVVSGSAERPASDGTALRKGDRVRTGPRGTATLVVRERRIVLGGATEVVVPDGATVDLARGSLLVDRRRGPGVTVRAGDTTVDQIAAGALRVERSLTVSVASLSSRSRVRTATGPRLDLPALHQVAVAGRALPRESAPLQLRHDEWELSVIGSVVTDDTRLNNLAAGLDGPGTVVPAAYTPQPGTRPSDVLLAEAIARAAGTQPSAARDLRARGGSWGVVAALVGTSALDAGTALADVLRGQPASVPQPGASSPGVVAGPTQRPVTGPTPSASPQPQPTRTSSTPRPSTSPTPQPTASSTPTSVQDVIDRVLATPTIRIPLLP